MREGVAAVDVCDAGCEIQYTVKKRIMVRSN